MRRLAMIPRLPLLVIGTLGAAAFLAGHFLDAPWLRLLGKPVPVVCLAVLFAARADDTMGRRTVLGLAFSAMGDVLLEIGLFLPGLAAFLAAHIAYTAAFLVDTRRLAWPRAVPFAGWGAGMFLLLSPGLGRLAAPVAVYVAAICTMMWRAAARVGARGCAPRSAWAGLLGGVLFAASDSLIGLDRFCGAIPGVRLPVMLLYWAGQLAIALAALWRWPAAGLEVS